MCQIITVYNIWLRESGFIQHINADDNKINFILSVKANNFIIDLFISFTEEN